MAQRYKIRRQPSIKGGRARIYAAVNVEIDDALRKLAATHRVSKSWVEHTLLADALNIKIPTFYDIKKIKKAS